MALQQKKLESLGAFMAHFNEEFVGVPILIVSLVVTALIKGLKDEKFKCSLLKSLPKAMNEVRLHVDKYINFEKVIQVVDNLDLCDLGIV